MIYQYTLRLTLALSFLIPLVGSFVKLVDASECQQRGENKRKRSREREHLRRHHNSDEYVSFDRDVKESPSHKPGNDRKKESRKVLPSPNGSIFTIGS